MAMRPTLEEVQVHGREILIDRVLDEMDYERLEERWLLEDILGVEDGPETDALIERLRRRRDEWDA